MNRLNLIACALALLPLIACADKTNALTTVKAKTSYAVGVNIATNFKQQKVAVTSALVAKGLKDTLGGKQLLMGEKEIETTLSQMMSGNKQKQKDNNDTKSPAKNTPSSSSLKTAKDRVSYAAGVGIARAIKVQGLQVDAEKTIRGIRDVLDGRKLLMTDADVRAAMRDIQTSIIKNQRSNLPNVAANNAKVGEELLKKNRVDKAVVETSSGLQYKILVKGYGKRPTGKDTVEVHYRAMRADGTEFDNTYLRGVPATFAITKTIPGWAEALKMMPVGSKWRLVIPPQLAYGARGSGDIGPNSTLIYDLELKAIK